MRWSVFTLLHFPGVPHLSKKYTFADYPAVVPPLLIGSPEKLLIGLGKNADVDEVYKHRKDIMAWNAEELDWIFRRTSGKCHLCHGLLARCNYAREGERGAWEVEHSVPRSKGGTDRLSNLYAAHIKCNRDKSAMTTRTARGWNGKTRAPMSPEKREKAQVENTVLGGGVGALVGLALGPGGWILGALVGGCFGSELDPDMTG